jgi:DNA-binding transcriptional LysR family regulator
MTHSVSEAAREMGITRSSIYRRIAQAQPYFQRAGMGIGKWDATNSA